MTTQITAAKETTLVGDVLSVLQNAFSILVVICFHQGAIFLYYAGRIKQVQGKLDEVSNHSKQFEK